MRWYGLMYVLASIAAYLLIPRQRRSREIGIRDAALFVILWCLRRRPLPDGMMIAAGLAVAVFLLEKKPLSF
jgi:hypothetical protein